MSATNPIELSYTLWDVTYPATNPIGEISTILLCSYTVGYGTYPATNPIGEISTILLCSYTVGYGTYPATNAIPFSYLWNV